jgi:hypothetical protein
MYTFAKITAITVTVDIALTKAPSFVIAGGVLPFSQAASVTPSDLSGIAGSKVTLASVFSKTRMKWVLPVEKYLGQVSQTNLYWINKTQALSSTPVSQDEPTFVWLTQNPTGADMEYIWQSVVTYHTQFFDPIVNNLSDPEFQKEEEQKPISLSPSYFEDLDKVSIKPDKLNELIHLFRKRV